MKIWRQPARSRQEETGTAATLASPPTAAAVPGYLRKARSVAMAGALVLLLLGQSGCNIFDWFGWVLCTEGICNQLLQDCNQACAEENATRTAEIEADYTACLEACQSESSDSDSQSPDTGSESPDTGSDSSSEDCAAACDEDRTEQLENQKDSHTGCLGQCFGAGVLCEGIC